MAGNHEILMAIKEIIELPETGQESDKPEWRISAIETIFRETALRLNVQNRSVYVLVCFDGENELVFVSSDSDKVYEKAFEFYERYPEILEFTPEAFQEIMAIPELNTWADRFEEVKHRSQVLSSTLYQEEL